MASGWVPTLTESMTPLLRLTILPTFVGSPAAFLLLVAGNEVTGYPTSLGLHEHPEQRRGSKHQALANNVPLAVNVERVLQYHPTPLQHQPNGSVTITPTLQAP